jgi:ribosomal protein S27AE
MLKSETRQTNWRRANMTKYNAHLAVQQAISSGKLKKQPCEVCGAAVVDAHHDRYDEPLNVRWLCRRHHVKLHQCGEDMFPIDRNR